MPSLWHLDREETQDPSVRSHIGGLPRLPWDLILPHTAETGELMTFFFSIDLGFASRWQGKTLSVFATTTYFDENDCIPQMFANNTRGYDVPSGGLDAYQRQFRIFITEASDAILREDYPPRIRYNVIRDGQIPADKAISFGQQNIDPAWVLDDETPGTYGGTETFDFLFQTREHYRYSLVAGAPRQMVLDYTVDGNQLTPSLVEKYDLWINNAAFFFITPSAHVLAIVQCN